MALKSQIDANLLTIGLLLVSALIVIPFIVILIYYSEQKQAEFRTKMKAFNEEIVHLDLNSPSPEDNHKLVCGQGTITTDDVPTDYLFHVRIKNAIRILRTVEVFEMKEHSTEDQA